MVGPRGTWGHFPYHYSGKVPPTTAEASTNLALGELDRDYVRANRDVEAKKEPTSLVNHNATRQDMAYFPAPTITPTARSATLAAVHRRPRARTPPIGLSGSLPRNIPHQIYARPFTAYQPPTGASALVGSMDPGYVRLGRVTDVPLDLSKIAASTLSLDREEVSLRQQLLRVLPFHQPAEVEMAVFRPPHELPTPDNDDIRQPGGNDIILPVDYSATGARPKTR